MSELLQGLCQEGIVEEEITRGVIRRAAALMEQIKSSDK
jgi:hypothetical protein